MKFEHHQPSILLSVLLPWQDCEKTPRTRTTRETMEEKQSRVAHAQKRKIRRLCGWNAYQRHRLEGMSLSLVDYKEKVRQISQDWRNMSQEDRDAFEIEAQQQQHRLDDLSQQPLPSATGASNQQEDPTTNCWRNGAKKRSARRLLVNKSAFASHTLWDLPTQYGDSLLAKSCKKFKGHFRSFGESIVVCYHIGGKVL